jgi:hypothetical protein
MWQASTIDWTGIGLLLIAAPLLGSQVARQWIIGVGTPPSATRWPRADGTSDGA